MDYESFIKTKVMQDSYYGFEVSKDLLNKNLFDFQRDICHWSLRKGRSALWLDCGLGKTILQLEWANQVYLKTKKNILILAPLAVSKQTKREGVKFGIKVNICRSQSDVISGINITNYEMLHKFKASKFVGIVLDESSIIKSFTGKFRNQLIELFESTPYKLCCTATPSPNDYMELGNHAEFLGVMTRTEMLSMFFVHDGGETSKWRLKGHAESEFWKWLCSWAVYMRKPSDLGYDDNGFVLPELKTHEIILDSDYKIGSGFFGRKAITLSDRREARKKSLNSRIEKIASLILK